MSSAADKKKPEHEPCQNLTLGHSQGDIGPAVALPALAIRTSPFKRTLRYFRPTQKIIQDCRRLDGYGIQTVSVIAEIEVGCIRAEVYSMGR